MHARENRSGVAPIAIIIAIVIALLAVGGGYMVYEKAKPQSEISNQNQDTEVSLTANWKTYRNEKYGFEVKYPPDFKIEFSSSSKMTGLAMCIETRCEKFLAIYEKPLPLTDSKYQNYRAIEISNAPSNSFYYYAIKTTTSTTDQIISTFRFIETSDKTGWKTYRNNKYGFEFEYPGKYFPHTSDSEDVLLLKSSADAQRWDIRIVWLVRNSEFKSVSEITSLKNAVLLKVGSEDAIKLSSGKESTQAGYIFIHNGKEYDFAIDVVNSRIIDIADQIFSTFVFVK